MAQVFISYSRKNKQFVQKLAAALAAEKREVWLDEKGIEPTAEWLKKIFDNIEAADNFLFVISPDSVVSTHARKEIDHAALNNKRIVPILYESVPDTDIPEAVAKYQRIDFTGSDDFDAEFAKVIAALDTDLDWKQAHTRLLTRATEWERGEKDSSFLLRGKDLREAEGWVAKSCRRVFTGVVGFGAMPGTLDKGVSAGWLVNRAVAASAASLTCCATDFRISSCSVTGRLSSGFFVSCAAWKRFSGVSSQPAAEMYTQSKWRPPSSAALIMAGNSFSMT